jgi:1-acyl-sn-glycerol-3-phosphate acyltransferase
MRLIDGIRSVFFNIIFLAWTVLFLGLIVLPLCFVSNEKTVRRGVHWYCIGCIGIARWVMGIRYEYRGVENIPTEGGFILAAAHQSNLDAMMTFPLRNDVTALAKRELFSLPIIGPILRKMQIIRIDRQAKNAHKGMQGVGEQVVEQGSLLLVYPQATRVPIGQVKRLKSGAFFLYADTGLPVVPTSTNVGLFWTKGFFHRSGKAVYEIGPAFPVGLSKDDFMKRLHGYVVDRSHELVAEAGYSELLPPPEAVKKAAKL